MVFVTFCLGVGFEERSVRSCQQGERALAEKTAEVSAMSVPVTGHQDHQARMFLEPAHRDETLRAEAQAHLRV